MDDENALQYGPMSAVPHCARLSYPMEEAEFRWFRLRRAA